MIHFPVVRRAYIVYTLIALAAAAFLFGGVFSFLAPCGNWNNLLFGARMWEEVDPGGYYLSSAHELYRSHGHPLYPGHPGLTLQILLNALQAAYYGFAAPSGFGFTTFIAKNIARAFFLSKMLITGLHVLSFVLLYLFALRLLRRERAALLSVLGYATSLPVVYYLSRISVEPLMVVFFLASFLCVWRSIDGAERRLRGPAALWAALAGAAAVCGLMTKFHLLWPLPFLCLGHLWWGDRFPFVGRMIERSHARLFSIIAFAVAALATFALFSALLDWRDFFALWEVGGMDSGTLSGGLTGLVTRQAGVLAAIADGVRTMSPSVYLPDATRSGAYFFCEIPMVAIAGLGAVLFFRRQKAQTARWLWLGAGVGYSVLIWGYRCFGVSHDFHGFHYLFVFTILAAVFFGEASDILLERLRLGSLTKIVAIALEIFLIHQAVFWGVLNSRLHDIASYESLRVLNEALASVHGNQRVAVIGIDRATAVAAQGLAVLTPQIHSALIEALTEDYIAVDSRDLARLTASSSPGERPIGALVSVMSVNGTPTAFGPFEPGRWLAETARRSSE